MGSNFSSLKPGQNSPSPAGFPKNVGCYSTKDLKTELNLKGIILLPSDKYSCHQEGKMSYDSNISTDSALSKTCDL